MGILGTIGASAASAVQQAVNSVQANAWEYRAAPGRKDPYKNFRFLVQIDGFTSAGFQKASGLKMNTDIIEYREGGEIATPHKSPGQTKFDNITLERGYSDSQDLWTWAAAVFNLSGGIAPDPQFRRNVVVQLLKRGTSAVQQSIVKEWHLYSAWVANYSGGDLDAMDSGILIESIEIAFEGFDLVSV